MNLKILQNFLMDFENVVFKNLKEEVIIITTLKF
jgi:hypothetical protein